MYLVCALFLFSVSRYIGFHVAFSGFILRSIGVSHCISYVGLTGFVEVKIMADDKKRFKIPCTYDKDCPKDQQKVAQAKQIMGEVLAQSKKKSSLKSASKYMRNDPRQEDQGFLQVIKFWNRHSFGQGRGFCFFILT